MIPEALAGRAALGFATVLGKYAAGRLLRAEPVTAAIAEVDRAYAGRVENVRRELERWLADPEVERALEALKAAPTREEPSAVLVKRFLSGDFFAGPDTQAAAAEILDAFLTALDAAVLRDPSLGPLVADARNARRYEALDRGVSEIRARVEPPPAPGEGAHARALARNESARSQLNPHSLPRIPRKHAAAKIRAALRRGVVDATPRVIPVIAAAGYGKSTLLGQLYDDLVADPDTGWVVLLLAADLPAWGPDGRYGATELAADLAGLAGTAGTSLAALADAFTRARGRGVVLIDTLDLVLTRRFVPAFRVVLEDLLAAGATVAFTCRDYEYGAFLADPAVLGTAASAMDRHGLADFDEDEVRLAATAFVERQGPIRIPPGEPTFADALLSMSAGSHSLREIVHNPLRLAMLCELFGRDLSVPEDLTASRLYSTYWDRKVASSRKHGPDAPVTLRMEQICLRLARLLFEQSGEHLREAAFTSDLLPDADSAAAEAYSELVSEDVLQGASGRRVRFFHQTFLEYAIARLAATAQGRAVREALLERVSLPEAASATLHLWPVLRQLVAIADPSDLDDVIARAGVERQAAFRAVALGLAAREEGSGLERLLPLALREGAGFQELLVNAALTAPGGRSGTAWEVVLEIVRRAAKPTAINAAKACGNMLGRFPDDAPDRLAGFFDALHANAALAPGDRTEVAGFFVSEGRAWLAVAPVDVLPALRREWPLFGDDTQAALVRLHARPDAPDAERTAMLDVLLAAPPGRRWRDDAATLMEAAAPSLVGPAGRWRSWPELLYAELPSGWSVVQGMVVGRRAAGDPELLRALVRNLLSGSGGRIHAAQLALREAARCGAGAVLAEALAEGGAAPADRYAVLAGLVSRVAGFIADADRLRLARWLADPASPEVEATITVLATAADLDEDARVRMLETVAALPAARRDTVTTLVLRLVHPSIQASVADHLIGLAAGDGRHPTPGLLKLYALRAPSDPDVLDRLLTVARGGRQNLALQAATAVAEAARGSDRLTERALLDLLRSPYPGVRVSGVRGLLALHDRGAVSEQGIGDAALALLDCTVPVVIGPFCDLVTRWTRARGRPPMAALRLVATLPDRIPATPPDSGIARPALIALKVAAQTEDEALREELSNWAIRFFRWFDVQRIGDGEGELIDLLAACRRMDGDFFPRLIGAAEGAPLRNLRAVALAIRRVEGAGSAHLDRLAAQAWCPMPVQGLILGFRGA